MEDFHSVLIKNKIILLLESIIRTLKVENKEEKIVNLYGIRPSFEKFLDKKLKKNDRTI